MGWSVNGQLGWSVDLIGLGTKRDEGIEEVGVTVLIPSREVAYPPSISLAILLGAGVGCWFSAA
jgi:hypothetical protein